MAVLKQLVKVCAHEDEATNSEKIEVVEKTKWSSHCNYEGICAIGIQGVSNVLARKERIGDENDVHQESTRDGIVRCL